MNFNNIYAVITNDWRTISRVKYRIIEMTYFPITGILIWGLFALYSREFALEAGLIILVVHLFWAFSELAQKQANILMMEDLWSLSVRHIFIAGVSEFEYILAKLFTSTIAAVTIGSVLTFIAAAFGAPIVANLSVIVILALITLIGSLALAVFIPGIIMTVGREYGFLAWSTLQLFVFFSAPFYSVDVFPKIIRWITEIMPFTQVFKAARMIAAGTPVSSALLWHAVIIVSIYFILSWPFYAWAYRYARRVGMLARIAR